LFVCLLCRGQDRMTEAYENESQYLASSFLS
jgi:hypothetical protein